MGWQGDTRRFVVHRLNRSEYGNAIRDLLALDLDVNQLLPSDGADFGFDNIASALKTSPLLLERYLAAAQRVSLLRSATRRCRRAMEYPLSREFTQSSYIEGLLGTHGGSSSTISSWPTANTNCRAGCAASKKATPAEGNDLPHTFVITVDG
jgi:hypothetical protein